MSREATFDQLNAVLNLNEGDKVLLTNGEIAEFIKAKRKNFLGIIDGKRYDISIGMYKETLEKVDIKQKRQEKKENSNNILNNLKAGDWFYINKNDNAIVFKFKEIKGKNIIAVNPIGDRITKIDINFEIGILK